LEALARGGLLAAKKHDPQFGGGGGVRKGYFVYSPYKPPFFENGPNKINDILRKS
jgi:hypothetical protein